MFGIYLFEVKCANYRAYDTKYVMVKWCECLWDLFIVWYWLLFFLWIIFFIL